MTSPNYVTRIRLEAKEQVADWHLPREMLVAVCTYLLTDLPAQPDRHLYEPIARPNLWAYHLILGEAPNRHFFTFTVERQDYIGQLHVLSGQVILETPPDE